MRQDVGHAKIRQDRRLLRRDLERGFIEAERAGVVAHLIGDRALRGEDAPIGLGRRVCVLEDFRRFIGLNASISCVSASERLPSPMAKVEFERMQESPVVGV